MALIHSPSPNLIGGVTQQPRWNAAPAQVKEQINAISDPVEGTRKRPPAEFIRKITGELEEDVFVHFIDRDADNKFFVTIFPGGIVRVFDLEGNEKTVTGSFPYLDTASPQEDLRAVTVADYTFLANRTVTVQKGTTRTPERPYEALIYVRAGNYGRTYTVSIDGFTTSIYTPDGSNAETDADKIDTSYIASQIFNNIPSGYSKERFGSTIYIASDNPIVMSSDDGQGNTAMKVFNGEVQRFGELPRIAKIGMILKVSGQANTEYDDHYVEFVKEGLWKETVKPDTLVDFTNSTMPVALVRNPDQTFDLIEPEWEPREAGDEKSAPYPSIVDTKINNIFFARDRLGFTRDEGVVMSRASEYFNFWPTTVTTVIDTDPIDVSATSKQVANIEHVVPFDKDLLLFSQNSQFVLGAQGTLTPETVSIPPVTEYSCATRCEPVLVGRHILFAFDRNDHTGIREYYVDSEMAGVSDADEVTAHCPTYIPSDPLGITVDTSENLAAVWVGSERNKLYIYKYFFEQQQKLQNSWSSWEFHEDDIILHAEFIRRDLFLFIMRADGLTIQKINIRSRATDDGAPYKVNLDCRVTEADCTMTYSATQDETYINLPFAATSDTVVVSREKDGSVAPAGLLYDVIATDGNQVVLEGDKTGEGFVLGTPYRFILEPMAPTAKTQAEDGTVVSDPQKKIKVKNYEIIFQQAGYFEVHFLPKGRSARKAIWTSTTTGVDTMSVPTIEDGQVRMKTTCSDDYWNLRVFSESHLPVTILNTSWEGIVASKSRG